MRITLVNKKEEPPFRFYVKENSSRYDYYVYDDIEAAMQKARIIKKYPVTMVMENFELRVENGNSRIFMFYAGECEVNNQTMLHAKFYLDAGECLNITELEGRIEKWDIRLSARIAGNQ